MKKIVFVAYRSDVYLPNRRFWNVILHFRKGFEKQELKTAFQTELSDEKDAVNLVFGADIGEFSSGFEGKNYIIYQSECLISPEKRLKLRIGGHYFSEFEKILANALQIWDFFPPNRGFYPEIVRKNVPIYHVPFGFCPYDGFENNFDTEKDFDFGFFRDANKKDAEYLSGLSGTVLHRPDFIGEQRILATQNVRFVLELSSYPGEFHGLEVAENISNKVRFLMEPVFGHGYHKDIVFDYIQEQEKPPLVLTKDEEKRIQSRFFALKMFYNYGRIANKCLPFISKINDRKKETVQIAAPKNKRPKVYLAIPNESGEIRSELSRITSFWLSPQNRYCEVVFGLWPQIRPVDLARNNIVEDFLRTNCTHLLMIDADMIPPVNILELADLGKPIVGGLCPIVRGENVFFSALERKHPLQPGVKVYGGYRPMQQLPMNQLVKVDVTGTGCLMIRRDVIEAMETAKIQPFKYQLQKGKNQRIKGADVYISEDFHFCEKAAELGFETFIHTGYSVSHLKTMDLLSVLNIVFREKSSGMDQLEWALIDSVPWWAFRYME